MSRLVVIGIALLLSACGPGGGERGLTVVEPWIRATPPGSTVAAGYMRLRNEGRSQQVLVGARSPEASRMELHTMREEDGMMRMRQVDSIVIEGRSTVALEPGGLHLMLFDIETAEAGRRVPVTLSFEDGWEVELSVPVRAAMGGHGH